MDRDQHYFRRIMHVLEVNYTADLSLEQLCLEMSLSATSINRILKSRTGLTFTLALREIRIRKACAYLRQTPLTVQEIAEMTGFRNARYFIHIFKERMEVTPGQYRRWLVMKAH